MTRRCSSNGAALISPVAKISALDIEVPRMVVSALPPIWLAKAAALSGLSMTCQGTTVSCLTCAGPFEIAERDACHWRRS